MLTTNLKKKVIILLGKGQGILRQGPVGVVLGTFPPFSPATSHSGEQPPVQVYVYKQLQKHSVQTHTHKI